MKESKNTTGDKANKAEKPEKVEPKFGVPNLAGDLGLAEASVRVGLRSLGVEKNFGNKYGWDDEDSYKEVLKALQDRSANNSKKAQDADEDEDEDDDDDSESAPAPKKGKKKGGKKVKRK